jgi:hypothetical protein
MALFGFSDISFNKGSSQRKGPLAPLVQNEFQTTLLRYPLDIGNADKGHYMVFYIREQRNTSFKRGSFASVDKIDSTQAVEKQLLSGLPSGVGPGGSSIGQELLGKVNGALGQLNAKTNGALSGVTSVLGKAATSAASAIDNVFGKAGVTLGGNSAATSAHIDTSIKAITGGSLGLTRTTKLTKDSIAMYMPDSLNYSYSQGYEDAAIGGELGAKVLAAGSSAFDELKEGKPGAAMGTIAKSVGLEAAKGITGIAGDKTGGQLFTAATGVVTNPMLEMIYSAPSFRSFQFEFTFYPRDETEALEVQRIIERFRFHQAPELAEGAKGFLVAPSEFDIKFYYAGSQNPNIPPIADNCVLTQMDVNYTPNGFTAYEVPGEDKPSLGRTGMPVAIQMQLQFKETTFLTKADFRDDKQMEAKNNSVVKNPMSGK